LKSGNSEQLTALVDRVLKLCTVISTLRWTVLTVVCIGLCHTEPISLSVDSFVFICAYFVYFCFILHLNWRACIVVFRPDPIPREGATCHAASSVRSSPYLSDWGCRVGQSSTHAANTWELKLITAMGGVRGGGQLPLIPCPQLLPVSNLEILECL